MKREITKFQGHFTCGKGWCYSMLLQHAVTPTLTNRVTAFTNVFAEFGTLSSNEHFPFEPNTFKNQNVKNFYTQLHVTKETVSRNKG